MARRPKIFLSDSHSGFCEFVADSLGDAFELAGSAHDVESTVSGVASVRPDAVVIDALVPSPDGLSIIRGIRELSPSPRIVLFAMNDVPATAFNWASLRSEISSALRGGREVTLLTVGWRGSHRKLIGLTSREREVVDLLAEGKLMKEAAAVLKVSARTIAFHKYGAMRKLGLRSTAELVRLAV